MPTEPTSPAELVASPRLIGQETPETPALPPLSSPRVSSKKAGIRDFALRTRLENTTGLRVRPDEMVFLELLDAGNGNAIRAFVKPETCESISISTLLLLELYRSQPDFYRIEFSRRIDNMINATSPARAVVSVAPSSRPSSVRRAPRRPQPGVSEQEARQFYEGVEKHRCFMVPQVETSLNERWFNLKRRCVCNDVSI